MMCIHHEGVFDHVPEGAAAGNTGPFWREPSVVRLTFLLPVRHMHRRGDFFRRVPVVRNDLVLASGNELFIDTPATSMSTTIFSSRCSSTTVMY